MASFNYKVGLQNVGSYQVSGKPFAEGGIDASNPTVVGFPYVTNWVQVKNNSAAVLKVGFSANGVTTGANSNYFSVPSGSVSQIWEVKLTELYLNGSDDVDVIAGLTGINTDTINNTANSPSGSNWSGSSGVG
jgi:hypothetical protein|tara:strand:- start:624 stop:1022 length:399 start_codon:yes stop_codon:yes gene_type:complete